ncbi:MAG TPA: hypothetical protein DCG49_03455 [Ruminococcus sp.]|nr:hypothetical protein [Ruminococcus sp.]
MANNAQTETTAAQPEKQIPAKKKTCVICTAAGIPAGAAPGFGGLVWRNNQAACDFVYALNASAKTMHNVLNHIAFDAENGKEALLPEENDLAYGKIDGNNITLSIDDASAENVAFSTDYHNSDRPLSFRFRMEDGSAGNVSTGFSDVLRDVPETGKSLTDDMVSFSDYDFKRLVSYYS